jgi:hypothetical protein
MGHPCQHKFAAIAQWTPGLGQGASVGVRETAVPTRVARRIVLTIGLAMSGARVALLIVLLVGS